MNTYGPVLLLFQATPQVVIQYDRGPMYLVAGLLLVLAFLFFLMLWYSNRLAQTGYSASFMGDAVHTLEREKLLSPINRGWSEGVYHRAVTHDSAWVEAHPIPEPKSKEVAGDYGVLWVRRSLLENGRMGTSPPGLGGQASPEMKEYINDILEKWANGVTQEANSRRTKDIAQVEKKAEKAAKDVLGSIDFATLWGQGPQFLLQFTAVVTIIFAVIALGILGRIGSEQAGTILAAIAGYVLGQATSQAGRKADLQTPTSGKELQTSNLVGNQLQQEQK